MYDLRGEQTTACICGCAMFKLLVVWDNSDKTIGWYEDKQECVECGAISTPPMPTKEDDDADI